MAGEIAILTAGAVRIDPARVLDRSDAVALRPPSRISSNGSCRLIAARDGWLAANLPRADDIDLIAAWLERAWDGDPWQVLADAAREVPADAFVARGAALGLAIARIGETTPPPPTAQDHGTTTGPPHRLRVLDLSTLWAGPLCGAILAAAGHEVTKVESRTRPDPTRAGAPAFDARLNGAKRRRSVVLNGEVLRRMIDAADVVITSARPRAFEAFGIAPAHHPHCLWVTITAHGWSGPAGTRIGFGDDAAVAGGLVGWSDGAPRFVGDAVADPLTGVAAAGAALRAIHDGRTGVIDMALAQTAAAAAIA